MPLKPLVVVREDAARDLHDRLAQRLESIARVVLDRRRVERRRSGEPIDPERRRVERRLLLSPRAQAQFREQGYRFVYATEAFDPTTGETEAVAYCPECDQPLLFEIPRLVEMPGHVEIDVRHLLSGSGARHAIDLEATLASGQRLLSCRLPAEEFPWQRLDSREEPPLPDA